MNTEQIKDFKEKLVTELALVEKELATVAVHNPKNNADWEAVPPPAEQVNNNDEQETADRMEIFEGNAGITASLETRFNEIKMALEKIEKADGTYGVCDVCGKVIEAERLGANPAAATCIEHM
jgi:DnaK suppressor protein